jgi:GMP synthase PP-ATPase subunit
VYGQVAAILSGYGMSGVVAPVGNVGVKGSARAYGSLVLVEAPRERYGDARKAANRLGNEVRGITRAALVLEGGRYSQGDWESIQEMPVTRERLELLREADWIAMRNLEDAGLYGNVSQMPVVLFPGPEGPWIALRPVVTPNFMTLRPPRIPEEMTWEYLDRTVKDIMSLGAGGVVLDCTDKPPATTEWE